MTDPASNVHSLEEKRPAANSRVLVDQIMSDLVKDEVIDAFEYDYDSIDLPLLSGQEKPVGTLFNEEKKAYYASIYINEIIEDFLREKNAEVADKVSGLMRDKELSTSSMFERLQEIDVPKADKLLLNRLHSASRLLTMLWAYSVKQRLGIWSTIGIRKNWIVAAYDQ